MPSNFKCTRAIGAGLLLIVGVLLAWVSVAPFGVHDSLVILCGLGCLVLGYGVGAQHSRMRAGAAVWGRKLQAVLAGFVLWVAVVGGTRWLMFPEPYGAFEVVLLQHFVAAVLVLVLAAVFASCYFSGMAVLGFKVQLVPRTPAQK